MSITELYSRHALPPRSKHIRILDIESVSAVDTEPLRCSIRIIDLNERPRFSALSYVWGVDPPVSEHAILCGDVAVPLTSNCHSALWHLRQKIGEYTIWVDAVCINQADQAEKEWQIPLMGDIFGNADQMYAWLGLPTPSQRRAIQYLADSKLEAYFDESRPFTAAWYLWSKNLSHDQSRTASDGRPACSLNPVLERMGLGKLPATSYEDLDALFDNTWVCRIWTYQEILLASNPIVVCGSYHIHWTTFEHGLLRLYALGSESLHALDWMSIVLSRDETHHAEARLRQGPLVISNLRRFETFLKRVMLISSLITASLLIFSYIVCFIEFGFVIYLSIQSVGLWSAELFLAICLFLCWGSAGCSYYLTKRMLKWRFDAFGPEENIPYITDSLIHALVTRRARNKKDMAFGMWAILERRMGASLGVPDYSSDTGDIYRRLAACLVRCTKSPDILIYAAKSGYPGQPSWVPDWSLCGELYYPRDVFSTKKGTSQTWMLVKRTVLELAVAFRTARRSMRPRSSTATQKDQAQELCIESDERDCTITVCADLFATVGTYLEKAEVTDICKAEEREAHLDSIRYLQSLIEPYSKTRYLAAIKHIRNPQVMEFLHANRHHTPAEILAMFQNGSGRRHEMLVQKFIHMCSPRSHRNLVQLTDASGNASLCYCLRAVAPGDHVIRVRGLAQLLVVGPLQQSQRDHVPVRIVGVSEWNTQTSDSLSGERILATPIKLDVRYRVY